MAGPRIEHRGCGLAYDVQGDGPAVLFIQGVGVHGPGWKPQIDACADRYRCVSFDNRGMGRSQPLPTSLTVEQMADDTLAVLDAAGVTSAHVVGHSLGGLVALHLALTARERVKSLALLCTFADGKVAAPLTTRMCWLGMRTRVGTRRMRRRAFVRLVMPPGGDFDADALASELAPLFGHDLGDHPPIVDLQLKAMRASSVELQLGILAGVPAMVVNAAHDPISPPRVSRAIADGIPGSRYVEFADASHGLPISHATAVNALLLDHLASAEQSST